MRVAVIGLVLTMGCSSSLATPTPAAGDASAQGEEASAGDDASGEDGSADDATSGDAVAEACVFTVDDAGVTHGCGHGGQGPGDHDDGGGAPPPPPPDAALDASDLPVGASCWDNAQCASGICFDYTVKGQFCTVRCDANADCPDTSLGCNGMGVCRAGS
jgi:hypothetical protein